MSDSSADKEALMRSPISTTTERHEIPSGFRERAHRSPGLLRPAKPVAPVAPVDPVSERGEL